MPPDPKPPKRIRDLDLLKELHTRWRGDCVLATEGEACYESRYSLHHIHKHPRDDLESNLAMLCGHGTVGHHGLIEAHDPIARAKFGLYLLDERPDTMFYLTAKCGGTKQAMAWLESQYGNTLAVAYPDTYGDA